MGVISSIISNNNWRKSKLIKDTNSTGIKFQKN